MLAVLALILAACGGDSADDDTGTEPADDQATTTTADTDAEPGTDPATSTTAPDDDTSDGTADEPAADMPDRSTGVVVIDGERLEFAVVDDGGACNPDRFGAFFALLTRVDGDGEPIEIEGLEGFTQGLTVSVAPDRLDESLIGGNFAGYGWSAGLDDYEESSIDSATIDGARIEGTVTFFNVDTAETVAASFEVTCVEGSVQATGQGGDFCDAVAASLVMSEQIRVDDPDIAETLPLAVAELDALLAAAPAGIVADVEIIHRSIAAIDEVMASYGYDLSAVPQDELEGAVDPAVEEAVDRLNEYCGLE